jgi:hypothetical protein
MRSSNFFDPDPRARLPRRALLLALPTAAAAVANACKKGPPQSCSDLSGLTPDDVSARTALGYADTSMDPEQRCTKCRQYIPAPFADACGGCKVMKGPIHPNGTCRAFAAL